MKIMYTMANDTIAQRPKRRYCSTELKGQSKRTVIRERPVNPS